MSNNLYNILKNFNKLTENTVAPDNSATPAEKIYESVEPQGSILSGVAKIESRLAKQFAESDFSKMSSAIQKSGKSKASADAITAAAGREKLGQREMTRRAVAGKKKAAHESVDEGIGDWMANKAFGPGSPTEIAGFASDKDYAQHYDTKEYPAAIQAIAQGGGVGSTLKPNRNTNAEVARAKRQLAHIYRAKGVKIDPSNFDELITNKIKADVAKAMGQQGVAEGTGPQSKLDQKIIHLLTNGIPVDVIARKLDIPVEWVHEVAEYNMPDSTIDYNDPRNSTQGRERFGEQGMTESLQNPAQEQINQILRSQAPNGNYEDDRYLDWIIGPESIQRLVQQTKLPLNQVRNYVTAFCQNPNPEGVAEDDEYDDEYNEGVAEGVVDPQRKKAGKIINRCFGKISQYEDDGWEYLDSNAPVWNNLFNDDQYSGDIDAIIANAPIDLLVKSAKELMDVVSDLPYELDEQGVAEAVGPGWYVRQEIRTGDPDRVAGPFPNQQQANMWIKSNVPPGDYEMYDTMEESMTEGKEECPDCECTPCECRVNESLSDMDIERQDCNSMSDAEFKRAYKMTKAEWRAQHRDLLKSKVDEDYKHKGRAYGGAAQKDDEDEDEDDTPKSKKVGAPKKKDSERSSASLPFGGEPDSGKHKLPAHKGATTRHSMSDEPPKGTPERAEWEEKKARRDKAAARKKKKVKEGMSRLESRFRRIMLSENFKQIMGKHHMTMDEMVKRLSHDIQAYKTHGKMSEVLRDCMEIHAHNPQIADESALGLPGSKNISQLNPGALKPPVTPWEKAKSSVASTFDTKDAWEIPAEPDHELNELARLAGLEIADEGTAWTGKLHSTAKGDSFELGGNTYKDTSTLDEGTCNECGMYESQCACIEGTAWTGKLHSTARGGKFKLAGNTYTDTSNLDEIDGKIEKTTGPDEVEFSLGEMARLAGIAVEGRDYGDTKIAKPAEFANTPEPEVMPANVMLKGGDGEVAGKEKKMSKNGAARFSDNPMESADPLESLGRRLMQAYNSIKIQK